MKKFLIVIDMQNDFVTGLLSCTEAIVVTDNIRCLIQNSEYDYVIFTKDTHYDNYLNTQEGKKLPVPHCINGTDGWEIVSMLSKEFGYSPYTLEKNSFGYPHWEIILRSYFGFNPEEDTIDIVGLYADICVISNALILKSQLPETKISVIQNCIAGTSPEKYAAALEIMKSCQIDIVGEDLYCEDV